MSFYKETTGYIIHQRNFKNTSLIIEFFSKEFGMIHLIAKGIKQNKKLKSEIQLFSLSKVQYFGKSQLKTISSINILNQHCYEGIIEKTAGLYLNELLHYSLLENDKSLTVFNCYKYIINNLGTQKLTPLLRLFEKIILKYNGFELNVDSFQQLENWLTVDDTLGITETIKNNQLCKVKDLKDFLDGIQLDKYSQKRLNAFMLAAIDMSISYKRLYSRELLKALF